MITKYFLICDITASPDELPKGLSFMVKASYKEEGSDYVTLETNKVSAIDVLKKKISQSSHLIVQTMAIRCEKR